MADEYSYIPFALPLIRRFFLEPAKAAGDIIDYGIYYASMTIETDDMTNAFRQLCYDFLRQGERMLTTDYRIPPPLAMKLVSLAQNDGFLSHVDYGGFDPETDFTEFNVDDDIMLLKEVADSDTSFMEAVKEWYRLSQVQDVVGMEIRPCEHLQIKDNYRRMQKALGDGKQIPVSCKTDMMLRMQDQPGTEKERAKLCMYLGIRSLIGKSKIAITTSNAIIWRMFGCRNDEELDEVLKDKRLAAIYDKWTSRYQYEKLLDSLRMSGLVNKISYGRNTIVTCSLQDDAEFMEAIKERINEANEAQQRRELKERERANREKLKAMLGGGVTPLELPFSMTSDG